MDEGRLRREGRKEMAQNSDNEKKILWRERVRRECEGEAKGKTEGEDEGEE